jgi:hypothetical protein
VLLQLTKVKSLADEILASGMMDVFSGPHVNKYLTGTTSGTSLYYNLGDAQGACKARHDCSGITMLTDSTTRYTLRTGLELLDSTLSGRTTWVKVKVANLCDQLLQQFHRVDEELSIQGKWQGGSVTGVCRGWGTNKVRTFIHSLGIFGDHWMTPAHAALTLCSSFYPSSPCII